LPDLRPSRAIRRAQAAAPIGDSPLDVGDLDVVIEVRTKRFEHRVQDKQRRADLICDRLSGSRSVASSPHHHGATSTRQNRAPAGDAGRVRLRTDDPVRSP